MASHILHLRVDAPSIRLILDDRAQNLWNDIVFHEEAQQYTEYDLAWERFLEYNRYEILEAIWDDFTVSDAVVTHG